MCFDHVMVSRRSLVAMAGAFVAAPAFANECPADKALKTPRKVEKVTDASKLTAEVVQHVDPTGWRGMKGLMLRTRMLTILPGGFVPTHSHEDRPAIIFIVSGELVEHSSLCSEPIVHKAGDSIAEFGPGLEHWWENVGTVPCVLTSSDLVPIEMMADRMMQMP
jgi:quercetin dioxygenase-like cupin family protein